MRDKQFSSTALVLVFIICLLQGISGSATEVVKDSSEGGLVVSTGQHDIHSPNEGFHWDTYRFSMRNAYWLSALSANVYADEAVIIREMERLGFRHESEKISPRKLFFLDQEGSKKIAAGKLQLKIGYADTQVLWAECEKGVLIAFRGTEPQKWADLITDLSALDHSTREMGTIHVGFYAALEVVWDDLYRRVIQLRDQDLKMKEDTLNSIAGLAKSEQAEALERLHSWRADSKGKANILAQWVKTRDSNDKMKFLKFITAAWRTKPIWITGHSLGGAIATIATHRLMLKGVDIRGLYVFGSPRAGDYEFAHRMELLANNQFIRENLVGFVNGDDLVPRIPPPFGILADRQKFPNIGRIYYLVPEFGKQKGPRLIRLGNRNGPQYKEPPVEIYPEGANPNVIDVDFTTYTQIPQFLGELVEQRTTPLAFFTDTRKWIEMHSMVNYVQQFETMLFN